MPISVGILQTVISFRFKLKKLLHKRHYEKFADGTVKDIEDEIPFDVPEGWAWCRLRSLVSTISSKDYQISEREIKTSGTYPVISQSANYIEGYCDESNYLLSVEKSIIIFGDHTRNVKYIDFDFVVGADGVKILKPTILINDKFLYYSILYASSRIVNRGYSRHFQFLSSFFFPIPSLTEQKLIVEQIENDYKVIDKIENNKAELQTCVLKAKSKILDLAIHGKLVPQDANDEPASVLLEKLRAEKEDKIAKGELKRDKNDSYIYKGSDNCYYQRFADGSEEQAEITYEIPPNWVWCSLGEISTKLKRGKSPTYTKKSSIMAFAQKCNQKEGPTTLEKALYIDESTLKKYPDEEKMQFNDIVINSTGTGTLGRVGVFNCKVPDDVVAVYPDSHVSSVRINSLLYAKYFYYFVKNKQSYLEEMGEGSTNQKELKIDTIANLIVPLPPLDEQKRIVEKIENAFAKLDSIAKQLE